MKRFIIVMCCLPAFLLAGCGNPLEEQGPDGGAPTTFTATIETESTKTALGSLSGGVRPVHWSQNDSISIGGGIYKVSSIDATDPTKATFTGSGATLSDGKYKAYYPKEVYNGGTLTLPTTQTYVAGRIDNLPMYAEAVSPSTVLNFKNLCAVLEFPLTGTKKVGSIELESSRYEEKLSGPFDIVSDGTGYKTRMTGYDAADQKVTLDCGTAGVQLNATTPTSFFIAIPAQEYSKDKLKVTVYDTSHQEIEAYTSIATATLQRSMIYEVKPYFGVYADRTSTETVATGSGVTDGGRIPISTFGPYTNTNQYLTFRVTTNLGGYTTTISANDMNHLGGAKFSVESTSEGSSTGAATTVQYCFWTAEVSKTGNTGTTVGLPATSSFTPKEFTVSAAGKKVYFSPGNLRYNSSSSTWDFSPKQYDFIETDARNHAGGWFDLFGWACSGWNGGTTFPRTAYLPTATVADYSAYVPAGTTAGSDVSLVGPYAQGDIGVNNSPIAGQNWRLLTGEELEYLYGTRKGWIHAEIPAVEPDFTVTFTAKDAPSYKVSYTIEKPKFYGLILFPDGFNTNLIDASIRGQINVSTAGPQKITNWPELEAAGCVLLPNMNTSSGVHYTTSTANIQQDLLGFLRVHRKSLNINYANTIEPISSVRFFPFAADNGSGSMVFVGDAVRLVRDASPTSVTGATDPYTVHGNNGIQ